MFHWEKCFLKRTEGQNPIIHFVYLLFHSDVIRLFGTPCIFCSKNMNIQISYEEKKTVGKLFGILTVSLGHL